MTKVHSCFTVRYAPSFPIIPFNLLPCAASPGIRCEPTSICSSRVCISHLAPIASCQNRRALSNVQRRALVFLPGYHLSSFGSRAWYRSWSCSIFSVFFSVSWFLYFPRCSFSFSLTPPTDTTHNHTHQHHTPQPPPTTTKSPYTTIHPPPFCPRTSEAGPRPGPAAHQETRARLPVLGLRLVNLGQPVESGLGTLAAQDRGVPGNSHHLDQDQQHQQLAASSHQPKATRAATTRVATRPRAARAARAAAVAAGQTTETAAGGTGGKRRLLHGVAGSKQEQQEVFCSRVTVFFCVSLLSRTLRRG